MSGHLYLLRHGETVWNRSGRLQGQLDAPLTRLGLAQAEAMGRTLRQVLGAASVRLVASPLGRTRQTAAVVAEHLGLAYEAIEFEARLMEITLGDFDGADGWDHVMARLSEEERRAHRENLWDFRYPNGESTQDVQDRVRPLLEEIRTRHEVSVVVAHGVVNKVLRGLHLGLNRSETFALDRPQDAIFRLHPGGEARIDLDVTESPTADRSV